MEIERKIVAAVKAALSELYGQQAPESMVQLQKTREEFEGELTLVVFPFAKMSHKRPDETAREVGDYLMDQLRQISNDDSTNAKARILDVRGRGLMIGVDLNVPHKEVRSRLVYEQHCFTGCAGTNVLRLLPPLCLSKAEADDFIVRLKQALGE